MLKKIFLTLILFGQTACTSVVWNGGIYDADRAINTHTVVQTTDHDQIHAFAYVPHNGEPLSGSLMMMGGKYWYAIQSDISTELLAPLAARLPQRYQITAPYTGKTLAALPVSITDGSHFHSDFCLDYHAQNPHEHQTLQKLRFQPQANPQHYRLCYAAEGTVYTKPQQFPEDYRFRNSIPIELTLQQNQTNIDKSKLASHILLTPLALAVDTVSGMIMLPILVIGDLF